MSQIITGALCWWNERPEDLDACVRGLGDIAHRVVALDGAYARYPGATAHSPDDQGTAIRDAAKAVGLDCLILQPDRLWAGQIEKRTYLINAASVGSSWIVTVDADHVISAARDDIHNFLRHHPGDVIAVPYITPLNPDRPMSESAVGTWHELQTTAPQFIPHIWRALPGMQFEKRHWWLSAIKAGQRVWLWGGDGGYPSVTAQNMRKGYTVEHRTLFRTKDQIRASRAFLNDRQQVVEQTGQEDNLPTLPPPVYDFRVVPW